MNPKQPLQDPHTVAPSRPEPPPPDPEQSTEDYVEMHRLPSTDPREPNGARHHIRPEGDVGKPEA